MNGTCQMRAKPMFFQLYSRLKASMPWYNLSLFQPFITIMPGDGADHKGTIWNRTSSAMDQCGLESRLASRVHKKCLSLYVPLINSETLFSAPYLTGSAVDQYSSECGLVSIGTRPAIDQSAYELIQAIIGLRLVASVLVQLCISTAKNVD